MGEQSDVLDVGEAFLAANPELSSKQVQKLAYYAQAIHLARTGEPLVADQFQAWVHGPVAPRLHDKQRGRYAVSTVEGNPGNLDAAARETVELTLGLYGHMTGEELERLSHADGPWSVARGLTPPNVASRAPIPAESVETLLAPRIRRVLDAHAGKAVSLEEFKQRFGV